MELIELHILHSFPVTCLNRDDVGAPKSALFGGCQRARVSSQCWKRAIRSLAREHDAAHFAGQRTRFVLRELEQQFAKRCGNDELARGFAIMTADALGKLDDVEKGNVKTLLFLSPQEVDAVVDAVLEQGFDEESVRLLAQPVPDDKKEQKKRDDAAKALAKSAAKAAKALSAAVKDAADIAVFGRMVADDHTLTLEGAGLFSHAISTHAVANEIDFFSAVDDMKPSGDDAGAGHIGTLEFNSACYYRYVGLNLGLLADESHLGHFAEDERTDVIRTFLRSAIEAVPKARKNSMFGFTPPVYVLGLRRTGQPLSLVNAFEKPIRSSQGYVDKSVEALKTHWESLKRTYCLSAKEGELPPANVGDFIDTLVTGGGS